MYQNSLVQDSQAPSTAESCIIRQSTPDDAKDILVFMQQNWGKEPLHIHGGKYYPSQMPGLLAYQDNILDGFLFYEIVDNVFEIIIIQSFRRFNGLGTRLLEQAKNIACKAGCTRMIVMTTNDNTDALRFYQTRGFSLYKIEVKALEKTRTLMPHISPIGRNGIPRRDELYLELSLID